MPAFGKSSTARLATCHEDLQTIFNEVIKTIDCSILCGFRNAADQTKAFAEGNSQVLYPNSKHNKHPSMAADVGPYFPELKNTDYDDFKAFALFAGRVIEIAARLKEEGKISHWLKWGGDFDMDGRCSDETFVDLPHFELIRP